MSDDCTCRSFPDRVCACHLGFVSHRGGDGCKCSCDEFAPTRPEGYYHG